MPSSISQFQFSLLPWFPKTIDFKVNRVHFFNFAAFKDKHIPSAQLRTRIEEYCALYVDESLKPLGSPTLAVIDSDYAFNQSEDQQLIDLQRYALAMMFCSIGGEREISICVSEQFTLLHQNFTLTEDAIAFTTGSFYHVTNWRSLPTTRLVRPGYVPNETILYQWDMKLMEGLANMIDSHDPEDEKVFEALRWVRYAFLNADGYSYESRVVMMATAFEIFFDLPRFGKEEEFARRLELLLQVDKMGHLPTRKPNARGALKSSTIYGWWARDFYSLRSKIVHQGIVAKNDLVNAKGTQYLLLAVKMLRFCLYRLLEERGYLVFKTLKGKRFGAFAGFSYERHRAERGLRDIEKVLS
ncbi:MAG TPA: hypothetical protein VLL54_15645 [Pyrinomonadaceae bacterium]|nr:hypothetical protein [Pyrinomonadaceae bacterium]